MSFDYVVYTTIIIINSLISLFASKQLFLLQHVNIIQVNVHKIKAREINKHTNMILEIFVTIYKYKYIPMYIE